MEKLRKLFKDKDKPIGLNLAVMAAVGVILLIVSSTLLKGGGETGSESENSAIQDVFMEASSSETYEERLEKRLQEVLSQVDGVGNVNTMITVSYSEEIIIAEDIKSEESQTVETDSEGGSRETASKTMDSQKIILQSPNGDQQPLVLKEIVPKVEGVIIVAEGGDNVLIKEALINAAKTVLGVESHKVQVLKMK